MRLHRFFTEKPINKGEINTIADSALIFQVKNVLRLRTGDRAVFFDGDGHEHQSEIISIGGDAGRGGKGGRETSLKFRVIETRPVKPFSNLRLSLAFSLIKKDKMEWIIEKCTEIGVREFIPLVSDRSEKKGFDLKRMKKISIEASEQSGRTDIPKIHEPRTLSEFLVYCGEPEKKKLIVFHTEGADFENEKKNLLVLSEIVACVGPEGGWSEDEIKMLAEKGAMIARLNAPVLRAETAAVAVSVLLLVK